MSFHLFATAAILALVLWAALHDVAARTIPNRVPVLLACAGLLVRIGQGQGLWACAAFAVVFALAFLLWRRGWMGGGDVKLFAAGVLAVPPAAVPGAVVAVSMAGGVLAAFYLLLRRLVPPPAPHHPAPRHPTPHHSAPRSATLLARVRRCEQWRIRRGGPLPYACAISAGIAFTLLGS